MDPRLFGLFFFVLSDATLLGIGVSSRPLTSEYINHYTIQPLRRV